ncbi:MAG TPA: bifunctional demethylmenaquinone methyltransferase/2-methoxy-6-polyprenyl-1,4-benzoquinol methylase UbiE [Campylobacteraceae bacterium]|nr:bifunctional demethylmenaquinone methyltransferase/2-methoxy-6-polyprenyl-1,4-benzoquinol methylase UbiE [Campylobacteraceae bacterium]
MNQQEKIVSMFDNIAGTYDVANRVLSFGVDKGWRKEACEKTFDHYGKEKIDMILDVACGTGDMCDYWDKFARKKGITIREIYGADPSSGMLGVAEEKGLNANFIQAEAKDLPVKDNAVDILSISYGLRNVVDRKEGLAEFYRVLKPGGMLVILEFTKLQKKSLPSIARDFYMKKILPIIGGLLSKNFDAYNYLPNSIEGFLTRERLIEELGETGFLLKEAQGYSMDISTLFIAQKPVS